MSSFIDYANDHPRFVDGFYYAKAMDVLPEDADNYVSKLRKEEDDLKISVELVDPIRGVKIIFVKYVLNKSFLLMQYVNQLRPFGSFINDKYKGYKEKLE